MTDNAQLKCFYEGVYKKGERSHYTQFRLQTGAVTEEFAAVLSACPWKGKTVLDVGCGTGELCARIAAKGAAKVIGVDYAKDGIDEAKRKYRAKNLSFLCKNIKGVKGKFDVIVSVGTLEHMDNPLATLKHLKKLLAPGGIMVLTSPNWLNVRGLILQTLRFLFDAPITLADIHYLGPKDFEQWAKVLRMDLEWKTVDQDLGSGKKLIADLQRRLPAVARDMCWKIPAERLDALLAWLEKCVIPLEGKRRHTGAAGRYILKSRTARK